MYLTYDDYIRMGGNMEDAHFDRYEFRARRVVDRLTHNRLLHCSVIPEAVKMCMYELVSAIHEEESTGGMTGREVASMSNDGVSVGFFSGGSQTGSVSGAEVRHARIVRTWLLNEVDDCGIPLMYAGVGV